MLKILIIVYFFYKKAFFNIILQDIWSLYKHVKIKDVVATTNQNNQQYTKVLSYKSLIEITKKLNKEFLLYFCTIYTTITSPILNYMCYS